MENRPPDNLEVAEGFRFDLEEFIGMTIDEAESAISEVAWRFSITYKQSYRTLFEVMINSFLDQCSDYDFIFKNDPRE